MLHPKLLLLLCLVLLINIATNAQQEKYIHVTNVDSGWAKNSVNVTVFRKNALVSSGDVQYITYYDKDARVVVGKRRLGQAQWQLQRTPYNGNAADAHNVICMMADGEGYLHLAWNHHNNILHYARSVQPGSLIFTDTIPMTGLHESKVTYPEFYRLHNGNLLFLYRDGSSGQGNLVMNTYNVQTKQWVQLHSNLVDGEGQRNAYWQCFADKQGTIHLSWVWRETPDVASNHDMCYACSKDGGKTWQKSTGEKYNLPITAASAEYVTRIPQGCELINQTSMFADDKGSPCIATYWRDAGTPVPQYHVICKNAGVWQVSNLGFRHTAFTLSGAGTKHIPIARPQVIQWQQKGRTCTALIFRDEERGNKVSIAISNDLLKNSWKVIDLTAEGVGAWEPSFDTELWKSKEVLHLFVQNAVQADTEGNTDMPPQMVQVLEVNVKGMVEN